jgi:hypothetical protein
MDTVLELLELHSTFGFGKFLKAREFKEQAEDTYYTVKVNSNQGDLTNLTMTTVYQELCGREVDDDNTIIKEAARAARAARVARAAKAAARAAGRNELRFFKFWDPLKASSRNNRC